MLLIVLIDEEVNVDEGLRIVDEVLLKYPENLVFSDPGYIHIREWSSRSKS